MKKIFVVAAFIFLLSASSCMAEQMTFKDVIITAINNNNELKAMKNSLSASERDIGIAKSNIMPQVKFNESFVSTNNPAQVFGFKLNQTKLEAQDFAKAPGSFNKPGNITNFLTTVSLDQTIYNRKSNIGISMAKKEYSAQGYDFLRKQEELVDKVSQSYLDVGTAREYLEVAVLDVNDAKEHLRIANLRYKNGLGLYSDVLRAQTAVLEAEQNYITSQKNLKVSQKALGLLLGKKESVDVQSEMPQIEVKPANYYNEISVERNDLKAMQIRFDNAKNNIKMAQSDYFPYINAGGGYQLYDPHAPFGMAGDNYYASASLNWDLFNGNKAKYEKLKAKDSLAAMQDYLNGLKNLVDYQVYEYYQKIEESQKNLELANSSLKSAQEGKRLVLKRWENSLSPFVDLLDAQANLDRSRANVVKSQNNYESALIDLSFKSGIIFKSLGID